MSAPVVAGIAVVGGIVYYAIMSEERKEELKREISEIYEDEKSIQKEGMAYDIGDKVEKRWEIIGEWKYYNREGKLEKIETYENSEIIKVEEF